MNLILSFVRIVNEVDEFSFFFNIVPLIILYRW